MYKHGLSENDKLIEEIYFLGGITQAELGVYLGKSESAILRSLKRSREKPKPKDPKNK
jgi:DNA-directed RNA polymerase specialized sigma subunit